MMKIVVLLVALFGLSHQVPVEVVVGTQVVEVTKVIEVTTTPEPEPEPEMNPFGECPPEDVYLPTFLSDTKNCSVFYQCAHGVPFRMECRLPLEFNPTLNVCDYPYRSGCLLKLVTNEAENENAADENGEEQQQTAAMAAKGLDLGVSLPVLPDLGVSLPELPDLGVSLPELPNLDISLPLVDIKTRKNHQ